MSIFIKILVYDSEMGEDFVNRFFGGELNKVVYYVIIIIIIIIIIITGSRLTYLSSMFLTRGDKWSHDQKFTTSAYTLI